MANGRGGARPGAGRPKGVKNKPKAPVEVDPALVNPRAVLASIAVDPRASALAKVRACETLLRYSETGKDGPILGAGDRVTARAIEMLQQGRPN